MQSVTYTIARPDTGAVLPYAVVTVYEQDGTTRASLFDAGGSAIGNPVDADANGAVTIAAANGTYTLSAVSAEGDLTLPNMTVQIFDMQALANAIAASGVAGVAEEKYATDADMRADLTPAAGTIALVYADADPLKNDLYYKIGGTGAGPWSGSLGLMAGLSYNYALQADGFRKRAGNTVPFETWTALAAAVGMVAGDRATVLASDVATHTDPVVGGTVLNAGVYTYSASPAGWQRVGDLDSKTAGDLGAAQVVLATAQAVRAEAAAVAYASQQWTLPAFSAQFPNFNRQFTGIAGHIAYPNTNLVSSPLLKFDVPSAFFIMLQVPHERTNNNRRYRVMGNGLPGAASSFGLFFHGDDYAPDATLHDRLLFRSKGTVGDELSVKVDVQTRAAKAQLLVVTNDGAGNYTVSSFAQGEAKIAGTTQASATHSLNAATGTHVLVGDVASAAGTLTSLAAPDAAFPGAIAFHGFVLGTAGDDAKWQAICEGADIAATLTGETAFKLFRDYRGGGNLSTKLAASALNDTTSAGTIYGTVQPGGSIVRQSASAWLRFDRLPEGYVLCPADNARTGKVLLSGTSTGLTGDVLARVVSTNGDVLVPPFRLCAIAATMAPTLELPTFAGWGFLECWATSDPSKIYRMNARIGCGDKAAVVGQSQADIAMFSANYPVAPSGRASFCGWMGSRSDPADTTSNPVPRFSTSARPQLFVIEPQMTSIYNGVTAMADRIGEHNAGRAICIIDCAIPGTGARDWINDSVTARLWAQDVEMAGVAGKDRTPVWVWYTNDQAFYPATLDAVVRGTGAYKSDHCFGDGQLQASGYKLGLALPTRATVTSAGPTDFDNFGTGRTGAQTGQIAFATSWPTLAVVGPPMTDIAIDNVATGTTSGANLGGPHQSQVLREGSYRLCYRAGETYLRARGISPTPNNSYLDPAQVTINGGRTIITVKAKLLNSNGRLITDNNMVRIDTLPTAGVDTVTIDGNVISYVASGATGLQVNVAANVAAQATALAACINANLSATHRAESWNAMVDVYRLSRGVRPVLALAGSSSALPGASIEGFEISSDAGVTWTRTGFTVAIVDNETVTLTKSSTTWPANVWLRAYAGGPFSYGYTDELNARYKGHLYDGCEAANGLGFPLLGFDSVTIA